MAGGRNAKVNIHPCLFFHKERNCSLHSNHEVMTFQYDIVPECRWFACNDLANFNIGNQDKLSFKILSFSVSIQWIIIDYAPFMSGLSFYSCLAYMIMK